MIGLGVRTNKLRAESGGGGNVAPSNITAPVISGSTSLGSVLSCTTGTWTGTPATFIYTYQWMRNGVAILGANSNTYTTTLADSSAEITCVVTANNCNIIPPSNTVTPVLSGTAVVGQTLSVTNGAWDGTSPFTYAYNWFRGTTPIGTNTNSYTLVQADAGNESNIKCVVTATNEAGVSSADSNTVAQILTVRTNSFLTASGISDATIRGGLNTFDVGLISNSLATKMKAVYPFVGGTASTHRWNFMDARDLDAAFRLVFNGTITHSSNGILGNGVNGFANTFLNTSTGLNRDSNSISFYSRTSSTATTSVEIGNSNGSSVFMHLRAAVNYLSGGLTVTNYTTTTTAAGFWVGSKIASNSRKAYYNGALQNTNTTNDIVNLMNLPLYILARNDSGTAAVFSDKQCAFAHIGDGLSDSEVSTLNTLVTNLQTTLGRNV